jgi:hypothetical protein
MALSLKKYGRIKFVRDRRCMAVISCEAMGDQTIWQRFLQNVKVQGKDITRIFFKKDYYEDSKDNLIV